MIWMNWLFPLLPFPRWQMKRKKDGTKIFNLLKSVSTGAEVEERNLIASLLTHMFSIDGWFSSIFIITISGSIPSLQDGYPICGLPISCTFPSSSPPLGHINIASCHKRYHRWPEQVLRQGKWRGNLSRLFSVTLKCLVRRSPHSWPEGDFWKT